MHERTDIELLDAWKAGETESGGELFERHFDRLARFFANKVQDGLDDLVQQTFLGAVEARDRFRQHAQFKTFLMAIAHNVLCKHYRKRKSRPELDFSVTSVADLGPSASLVLAQRREQKLLLAALRAIPLEYQTALELFYWEQLSAPEIADVLALPLGTVKTRLRRARQLVDGQLEQLAESPTDLEATTSDLEGWARSLREAAAGVKAR